MKNELAYKILKHPIHFDMNRPHESTIAGAELEESLFDKFKNLFRNFETKNTVLISGWKDNGSKDNAGI